MGTARDDLGELAASISSNEIYGWERALKSCFANNNGLQWAKEFWWVAALPSSGYLGWWIAYNEPRDY
ncbi:hypothetical protein L484_007108 [Morus notabilis]|uniref:Uncharacterized protein n=1 Tax=Morus notabilis TaxID=981085 RepID=W9RRP6_9ROSA|nr:hypothetical protein L484_007108 [Morus notabilis]